MKQYRRIAFSDRQMEMIEEIKQKTGTGSISEVLRQSVFDFHRSLFPVYKQKDTTDQSVEKMEKIAKNKVLMKDLEEKAKEEIRLQPFINSCLTDFKGRVEGDMCKFMVYGTEKQFDNEDEIGLESCSPEMAEARMFLPSKEAVFNKRKDVKKLYD